jgi:class 3 adenylate cyclase
VAKIETVGKTYMGCAGFRDSDNQLSTEQLNMSHARRALELAVDILRVIKTKKLKNGDPLLMKIGINTGKVTAGVVGHHKP